MNHPSSDSFSFTQSHMGAAACSAAAAGEGWLAQMQPDRVNEGQ